MTSIHFKILQDNDHDIMQLIAAWYLREWNISIEKTIQKLKSVTADPSQCQIVMYIDNVPIATGGLYHHVGLLDKEPRLKIYKNWLALVYTIPEKRHVGYGALLCKQVEEYARKSGLSAIYLFTDTAERLYQRLGWIEFERLLMNNRIIVIMEKGLTKAS